MSPERVRDMARYQCRCGTWFTRKSGRSPLCAVCEAYEDGKRDRQQLSQGVVVTLKRWSEVGGLAMRLDAEHTMIPEGRYRLIGPIEEGG